MKKTILTLLSIAALSMALSAQAASGAKTQETETGAPDPSKIGIETAQQKLMEISVDKFEAAGFWEVKISSDEGVVNGRLFEGQPQESKDNPLKNDPRNSEPVAAKDKYVFGAKTEFYQRGYNEIYVSAKRPIPIEGIAKTISVWVIGRNYNHNLYIELKDFFGNSFELPMGKLNFQGWKKLSVAIPPQNPDGRTGIVQRNFHYASHQGLKIVGFRIECDPEEAFGTYYVYFDDLRAVTDLFSEDLHNLDKDDMADTW
jgi:hypothetical protein